MSKYTIKEMKPILRALGVKAKNAPDKNYPRLQQFREALYPAWVEAKASRQIISKARHSATSGAATSPKPQRKRKNVNTPDPKGPDTPQPPQNKKKKKKYTPDVTRQGRRGHLNNRNQNKARRKPMA